MDAPLVFDRDIQALGSTPNVGVVDTRFADLVVVRVTSHDRHADSTHRRCVQDGDHFLGTRGESGAGRAVSGVRTDMFPSKMS